ncbi:MAG: RNA-binding protein [Nitrospinae bacterium]|nr:RNA-binding protein [Nitrospinota bacterium]
MNIYIGNLSYTATEDDLRKAFSPYGTVDSARIIIDRATGKSKGFGFVSMPDDTEGRAAIAAMNGGEVAGRKIRADEARPREGGGGFGR